MAILRTLAASLRRLTDCDCENLVQGHGEIILRGETQEKIASDLDYLRRLDAGVREGLARGDDDIETRLTLTDCGKQHDLLQGLAGQLHRDNLRALHAQLQAELQTGPITTREGLQAWTPNATYLTRAGEAELRNELRILVEVRRPELARKLKNAVAQGDLKENADYHDAKEQLGFVEGRVQQLEVILRDAVIVEAGGANDEVRVGSTVEILEDGEDESEEYQIVGSAGSQPQPQQDSRWKAR